jgi:hypothetical protein
MFLFQITCSIWQQTIDLHLVFDQLDLQNQVYQDWIKQEGGDIVIWDVLVTSTDSNVNGQQFSAYYSWSGNKTYQCNVCACFWVLISRHNNQLCIVGQSEYVNEFNMLDGNEFATNEPACTVQLKYRWRKAVWWRFQKWLEFVNRQYLGWLVYLTELTPIRINYIQGMHKSYLRASQNASNVWHHVHVEQLIKYLNVPQTQINSAGHNILRSEPMTHA